jgi:hypothetical protein
MTIAVRGKKKDKERRKVDDKIAFQENLKR